MIVLAATTSTRRGGVALMKLDREPEILAAVEYEAADDHAEKLFRALDEAMNAVGIERGDISRVACDVGPGSFTGIRAGTAALSAIAWSLGLPTVAVGSLEAMAFAAQKALGKVPVLTLLDARRNEVFGAVYGPSGVLVEPFVRPRADEAYLVELEAAHAAVVVGEIASSFPALEKGIRHVVDLPRASVIAQIAIERTAERAGILPVYVRAPDAKTIAERASALVGAR